MSTALSNSAFQILLALTVGERHGYAIMKDVEAQSEGAVTMGPGTLYAALKKLLAAGLIAETEDRPDPALDDQRRRYYRITPSGLSAVRAEAHRLSRVAERAGARLAGAAPAFGGSRP